MDVPQDWMPPDMDQEDKDWYAETYPTDPHRAASEAWGAWAGTLAATPAVASVSTGDQSVTYSGGSSPYDAAIQRSNWHAARSKVSSVPLGARVGIAVRDTGWLGQEERDPLEGTVIETYDAGTVPPIEQALGTVPEVLGTVPD